jgi:peptidoglycan hydrolase-like protein with peptidoglycan-binding domain
MHDVYDQASWRRQTRSMHDVDDAGLEVDGVMGPLTLRAIENLQREQGLVVDGIVGPLTTAALKHPKASANGR